MQRAIGIDPSQRHTGIAILENGSRPAFYEIKGKGDILSCALQIRQELTDILSTEANEGTLYCVEKQLSVGGHSSSLQFYIQMIVLETIGQFVFEKYELDPVFVMPLPVQLKSFMQKAHDMRTKTKTEIVESWKEKYQEFDWAQGRISSHKVDAFCLANMGLEIMDLNWEYKLPTKEAPLIPWEIICRRPSRT